MEQTIKRKLNLLKAQPIIVWLFLAIQVLVFLAMTFDGFRNGLGFDGSQSTEILVKYGALNKNLVMYFGEYWRLVTPMFVHIGIMHLLVNSVTLYFLGSQLEGLIGHWRFAVVYLLAGFSGNVLSFALNTPQGISAGASTALFGLFGYFVALGRVYPYNSAIRYMAKQMGTLIFINLLFNLFSTTIDMWGHIGGVIGGFLLGFIVSVPKIRGTANGETTSDIHRKIRAGMVYIFMIVFCLYYVYRQYLV